MEMRFCRTEFKNVLKLKWVESAGGGSGGEEDCVCRISSNSIRTV